MAAKEWKMAECPCCGVLVVRKKLLTIMDAIRDNHGDALRPTSWCRCLTKNTMIYRDKNQGRAALGKSAITVNHSSPHLIGAGSPTIKQKGGWAVDLPVVYADIDETEEWLRALGVVGAGFGPNFTHVDIKPRESVLFRSWTYKDGAAMRRTLIPKE